MHKVNFFVSLNEQGFVAKLLEFLIKKSLFRLCMGTQCSTIFYLITSSCISAKLCHQNVQKEECFFHKAIVTLKIFETVQIDLNLING